MTTPTTAVKTSKKNNIPQDILDLFGENPDGFTQTDLAGLALNTKTHKITKPRGFESTNDAVKWADQTCKNHACGFLSLMAHEIEICALTNSSIPKHLADPNKKDTYNIISKYIEDRRAQLKEQLKNGDLSVAEMKNMTKARISDRNDQLKHLKKTYPSSYEHLGYGEIPNTGKCVDATEKHALSMLEGHNIPKEKLLDKVSRAWPTHSFFVAKDKDGKAITDEKTGAILLERKENSTIFVKAMDIYEDCMKDGCPAGRCGGLVGALFAACIIASQGKAHPDALSQKEYNKIANANGFLEGQYKAEQEMIKDAKKGLPDSPDPKRSPFDPASKVTPSLLPGSPSSPGGIDHPSPTSP